MANYRIFLIAFSALPLLAQRGTGDLRLHVVDASGLGLAAEVRVISSGTQIDRNLVTPPEGNVAVKDLPFGIYRVRVSHAGFAAVEKLVEIRSEAPLDLRIRLEVAAAETTVVIEDSETLLDPHRAGPVYFLGQQALREHRASLPSRGVLELVESQPGWLMEANGVLHPRGSEYNTQFVVDGIPLTDNRSAGFAPPLDVEELQSMNVFTASYPAEYGRKLGGVVEATTARAQTPGFHGRAALQGGSFDTESGFASGQYVRGRMALGGSVESSRTDRYLDPPAIENFSNHGFVNGARAQFEEDITQRDRLRVSVDRKHTGFLVPNEVSQQAAGQRQDRTADETMGIVSYQRVLPGEMLLHLRGMVRDLDEGLRSNAQSTPIQAFQNRGFREAYTGASVAGHRGRHDWKAGGEWIGSAIREDFRYHITNRRFFDPETPRNFSFADRRQSRELAGYVQDSMRAGNWTFSAGLRWDGYRLLVRDSAVSPRLGVAWNLPRAGLVLRASYDRAFQVPAIENLLLTSSVAAQRLNDVTTGLPVPASRGNFYQAGFSKSLGGHVRLDGTWFRRDTRDFSDDSLLLNTGVSFPISFAKANVHGYEAKLEIPRWGTFSGFLSYSNLNGTGELPVTGGLFLGDDSAALLQSRDRFPVTQDQRNTVQGRVRWQAARHVWTALGSRYGSGLPVELEGTVDPAAVDPRLLEQVNQERGRLRPSWTLDVAAGADLFTHEKKAVRLQGDVTNLTDRLNVINFAGLFSGTAVAAPRAFSLRMSVEF